VVDEFAGEDDAASPCHDHVLAVDVGYVVSDWYLVIDTDVVDVAVRVWRCRLPNSTKVCRMFVARERSRPSRVAIQVVVLVPLAAELTTNRAVVRLVHWSHGVPVVGRALPPVLGHGGKALGCLAPGLMETSDTRRIHGYGCTTEVPGGAA
jgi:hypothetical protein